VRARDGRPAARDGVAATTAAAVADGAPASPFHTGQR
jgi:uncharacterized Zn-binding protein involved in type VI secretion